MIKNYSETYFAKLSPNIQEQLYLIFKKSNSRTKVLLFTKLKFGEEITFKELSEKMHVSTVRNIYIDAIRALSGVAVN